MWIDIIRRLDLDFLHEADEWQQNDNTISKKSTQQVEIRQNSLVSAVKTNKKHHITTLQRGVWVGARNRKPQYLCWFETSCKMVW